MLDNAVKVAKAAWNLGVSVVEFALEITGDVVKRLKFEG